MCYYVTAICSSDTQLSDINTVGKAYDLAFEECANEYVQQQILKTEKYLWKTSGVCDCGTAIGVAAISTDLKTKTENNELERLKKKGWTATKINRYLSDKQKQEDKNARQQADTLKTQQSELDNYIAFINDVLMKTNTKVFGLILHWYTKGPENENIRIKEKVTYSCKELTDVHLKTLENDTLLRVTK